MTNSTIPAEAMGSPSPVTASYRWEAPGKPISIQLSLDLIDRLEREVIDAFKAVTKRGSEIGGVLLGRIAQGAKRTVFVENFEPVICDYSRGPLYLLSDADKERLREIQQRLNASPLSIVGFFRSNTRRDLAVDDEDLGLFQEFFSDSSNVFLLVKPFAMKPSAGGFHFWEEGRIQPESYLQFPFRRSDLMKTSPEAIVQPAAGAETAPAPAAREERAAPMVFPKREERAPIIPSVKREEPRPGPVIVTRREEPPAPPVYTKREEPVYARPEEPPVAKRETPPPPIPPERPNVPPVSFKRESRPPMTPKREERPPVAPLSFRREDRPGVKEQPPVAKREERPVPPRREERPAVQPTARREERPAVVKPAVTPAAPKQEEPRREERPAVAPVARREEPVAPPPPPVRAEEPPMPVEEPPVRREEIRQERIETAPAPRREETYGAEPEPAKRSKMWLVAVLALVAIVGAGSYYYFVIRKGAETVRVDESPFGLRVERSVGQVLLSWKKDSEIIASARRGVLSITDGETKEDVELDQNQLRTGAITYAPITNDVSFRLEVIDPKTGRAVSESLRALAGVAPAAGSTAATAKNEKTPAATPAPAGTTATPAPTTPAPSETASGATGTTSAEAPLAVRLGRPSPIQLAQIETRAAQEASIAPAPSLDSGSALPAGRAIPGGSVAVPAAPRPAAPPPAAAPAPTRSPAAAVQEARVRTKVRPAYPEIARKAHVSGSVTVQATVDREGKVRRAVAISGSPLLRQAAQDAVMRWTYDPATLNGQPVESVSQVQVEFILPR